MLNSLEALCMSCLAYAIPGSFLINEAPVNASLYQVFNVGAQVSESVAMNLATKAGKVRYLEQRNWVYFDACSEVNCGYQSIVFVNHISKDIVLAHRGTASLFQQQELSLNAKCNIQILSGACLELIPELTAFLLSLFNFISRITSKKIQEYTDYTLWQTGHSLGGFLAEVGAAYIADQQKSYSQVANAITFDSLGSIHVLNKLNIQMGKANTEHYFLEPNITNTTNAHDGACYLLLRPQENELNYNADHPKTYNIEEILSTANTHSLVEMMRRFDLNCHAPYNRKLILEWPRAVNTFGTEVRSQASSKHMRTPSFEYFMASMAQHLTEGVNSCSHHRIGAVKLLQVG